MSRQLTTEFERQNINVRSDLAEDIDQYLRKMELETDTRDCFANHPSMNAQLRARMVDWMIEVLTNFKCDDLTYFIAVSLMDRYFKGTPKTL